MCSDYEPNGLKKHGLTRSHCIYEIPKRSMVIVMVIVIGV